MYGRKRTYGQMVRFGKKRKTVRNYNKNKAQLSRISQYNVPIYRLPSNTSASSVPQLLRTKMIYYDAGYTLNPGLGTPGVQVFSANGIFDVDITGIGHQPASFDQMMLMYKDYVVLQSSIRASVYNIDDVPCQFGITILDSATVSLDTRQYVENGSCVWQQKGLNGDNCSNMELRHKVNIGRWNGNPSVLTDDTYRGTASTNPTDQTYYHVWLAPTASTEDPPISRLVVELQYEVIFKNPRLNEVS